LLLFAFLQTVAHTEHMTTVDLLLHPVRLRILQAFLGGRELTTAQLAVEMGDIPTGRIYRHVTLLANAGVLIVKSEQRVRGAVERAYGLGLTTTVSPSELGQMSRDEHLQAFTVFVAGLLASYERYLESGKPDLERDGVSYSMNAFWLSDEEYTDFLKDVGKIVAPRTKLKQTVERKRRLVASVFMPLLNPKEGSNG
jgi:hypothetical protein